MSYRINRITVTLDVYEPFTGTAGQGGEHAVTFEVDPTTDPALLAACEAAWRVWYDRMMAGLKDQPPGGLDIIL